MFLPKSHEAFHQISSSRSRPGYRFLGELELRPVVRSEAHVTIIEGIVSPIDQQFEGQEIAVGFSHFRLSGVEKLVESGIADGDRLGLMGHSYGGYCVNALVTQTSRFKAAVNISGLCNLVSAYGVLTDAGDSPNVARAETGQLRMGGAPWQCAERYVANSPVFHLDRVVTPLLLVHGELDNTCRLSQAEEMFTGLRRLGREAVLLCYRGEGHWPGTWQYTNAVDYWERILDWFDTYLVSG